MPRDLTVRVRADVGAYQKAMSSAASSTDQFAQAGMRLQKVGLQISNLGDSLTKNVTLPLALVGGAAIKMASDFDKSFTTMQTLAGVSASAVDGLKESVLDLSGQTGRAPQELAEALYFLQSSGLDSAAAMEALEVSAKASAVGLGDTQVIADAVSSAMLGYAESGLEAAEATDILIATARAGKAEPAELAGQMGRLIPIASELGISFDQVGGAIAALSTKGNSAEAATTQLVNVMSKLLKPSEQAAKLLDQVGLSAEGVRSMLAEKGLLGTLEELRSRLGEAGFTKFLEDTQAIQGGLALLGGDLNKTKDIFDQVADSAGATDSAFATWAESMGAQNAQAFAEFQVALIRIGEVLAPIASDVLNFVSKIAEAFSALPEGAQQGIIAFGLVAAAIGPLMSIGGRLITVLGTSARLMTEFAVPAGSVSGAFNGSAAATNRFAAALGGLGKIGLVVGILVGLREVLGTIDDEIDRVNVSTLENQLLDLAESGEVSGSTLKRVFSGLDTSIEGARQFQADLKALDDALTALAGRDPEAAAAAFKAINEALQGTGASTSQIKGAFDGYNAALAEADTANRTTGAAVDEATGAIDEQIGATEEATSALQEYLDTLHAQIDPMFAAVSATRDLAEANAAVTGAEMELAVALTEHGAGSLEAMAATDKLTEAQLNATNAAFDQESALVGLVDMVRQQPGALDTAKAKLNEWVAQGLITQASADTTAAKFDEVAGAANAIPVVHNTALTTSGTSAAAADMNALKTQLDNIPRNVVVNVTTLMHTIAGSMNAGPRPTGRQHGGPVHANRLYEVVEQGLPEMFEQGGRTFLLPGADGRVVPAQGLHGGGIGGGSVQVTVGLHVTGDGGASSFISKMVRTGDLQLSVNGTRVQAA